MKHWIRVTGTGRVSRRPDTVRISMSLADTDKEYEKAAGLSDERALRIRQALSALGFEKEEIKTTSFRVDSRYENVQKDGVWREVFMGYEVRHDMALEFPYTNERLGEVLTALSSSGSRPEFHLAFTVKDPEEVREELMAGAVRDARRKAEVLAQAAGAALGELVSVRYGQGGASLEIYPVSMDRALKAGAVGASFSAAREMVPEDIKAEDTAELVWELA